MLTQRKRVFSAEAPQKLLRKVRGREGKVSSRVAGSESFAESLVTKQGSRSEMSYDICHSHSLSLSLSFLQPLIHFERYPYYQIIFSCLIYCSTECQLHGSNPKLGFLTWLSNKRKPENWNALISNPGWIRYQWVEKSWVDVYEVVENPVHEKEKLYQETLEKNFHLL